MIRLLRRAWLCLLVMAGWGTVMAALPKEPRAPEQPGLDPVGSAYFPQPEGSIALPMYNCSFETVRDGKVAAWTCPPGVTVVEDADAPDGTHYLRVPAKSDTRVFSPGLPVAAHRIYLLSFWLRSTCSDIHFIGFNQMKGSRYCAGAGSRFTTFPNTEGKWKRVGFYYYGAVYPCEMTWVINPRKDVADASFDIDDVQVRTVTAGEYSTAYQAWRKTLPAHDITPRADDGRHLALSIAKLEGKGEPGKPFLIWAIGASWTNMLGDGETLTEVIRQRFPQAPEIIYRKHAGSGTPWEYTRGWARQFVISEQPDLILTYTQGDPEKLALMLQELRQTTTTDILVGSLHLFSNEQVIPERIDSALWNRAREVCAQYGVEFVENRRELAAWLTAQQKPSTALLLDAVHENELGQLLTNENLARHFAHPASFAYDPAAREHRIAASAGLAGKAPEMRFTGKWQEEQAHVTTATAGATLEIRFTGTRLDLIGWQAPTGGTLDVQIDGKPAAETPDFFTDYITPRAENAHPVGPAVGDVGPHGTILGQHVVPQTWTITMLNDSGDFQVAGSVTGADGQGNCLRLFTGDSGQIVIDPDLWRYAKDAKGAWVSKTGDSWHFQVYRIAVGEVTFRADTALPALTYVPIVQNLPNAPHTITLTARGDGPVTLDSAYVYCPQ